MHVKEYLGEWSDTNKNRGSCAKWAAFQEWRRNKKTLPFLFIYDYSAGGRQL